MGGGGIGWGVLSCHGLGISLPGSEEGALGREWSDGVVWGSTLFGGEGLGMQLGLGFLAGEEGV